MRTLYLMALVAGLSIAAQAEDWAGNLIDAVCHEQAEKTVSCDATNATAAFALDVSGKIYKLDIPGNIKAAAALKYRAAPAPDATKQPSTAVKAKVTGTEAGGMILVESISLP